jgi:ammonium transporter, Amt family
MFMIVIGLTMIEVAQVRPKNRQFVVTKNMMIMTLSLVVFFVIGYAFAFGKTASGVVGAQSNYVGVFTADN